MKFHEIPWKGIAQNVTISTPNEVPTIFTISMEFHEITLSVSAEKLKFTDIFPTPEISSISSSYIHSDFHVHKPKNH